MKVLVLNYGSSSLKWSILDASTEEVADSGAEPTSFADASRAVEARLRSVRDVGAVGHRVVHGGTRFRAATKIDPAVRAALAELVEVDPLHAPSALAGIDAATRALPRAVQVAAFDTAFHATIPEANALYPLPRDIAERAGARKLGFHGLSVSYAIGRAEEMLGALPSRVLVMHLGSGASITAVKDGASLDTTMGWTPLDGLMMGTRAGALDPGLLLYVERRLDLRAADLERALSERAGLVGVSGVSADLREVLAAADRGDARARLAYEMLVVSIKRQAGAMLGALGGLDALVFTGGAGEGSARLRRDVCAAMDWLGVRLDARANDGGPQDRAIGARGAAPVLVVHAREDIAVLREVVRVLGPRDAAGGGGR